MVSKPYKGYNGHKNWNHWNVALWIANDEGLYRWAVDTISDLGGKEAAARHMAKALAGETTPDGAPYTYTSIRAALVGLT
jgi:hypothetical protein